MANRASPLTPAPDAKRRRRALRSWGAVVLLLLAGAAMQQLGGVTSFFGVLMLVATLSIAGLVLARRLWNRLLWRTSRRLAFSYLLLGLLPIPLLVALLGVGAYLLSGFYLGREFRDACALVYRDAALLAAETASHPTDGDLPTVLKSLRVARYRGGRLRTATPNAPPEFPTWLAEETKYVLAAAGPRVAPPLVRLADGRTTIAAATERDGQGAVVWLEEDLATSLLERAELWLELTDSDTAPDGRDVSVQVLQQQWRFRSLQGAETRQDMRQRFARLGYDAKYLIVGLETPGPTFDFATGETAAESTSATLFAPPARVINHLVSKSAEVDTIAWVAFLVPAFLLFDIYLVAVILAMFMIFGLSRAINHLSVATAAVAGGEFSQPIVVRRRDQLGDLQRSFNDMTERLEHLVESAAAKEIIEKELEIARDLQLSLLPTEIIEHEAFEFASSFEPSSAIGGDYYDVLPHPDGRSLAVIVADVSGHGLPAGMRMAMIRAGLKLLVADGVEPRRAVHSLDSLVRQDKRARSFVTLVFAQIDLRAGRLHLVNAGHPPTYLLRDGVTQEIALAGNPLGVLGQNYGETELDLAPGDVLVWLSDGLIEITDLQGEAFGYDRIMRAIDGEGLGAKQVLDRVLASVRRFAGTADNADNDDDCTLVVMRYRSALGDSLSAELPAGTRASPCSDDSPNN